jgi:hypothetical protein
MEPWRTSNFSRVVPTKKVGATRASLGATVYPTRQRQATNLRITTSILVHAVIRHRESIVNVPP